MSGSLSFKSGLMLKFPTLKLRFDVDILAFYNLSTDLATYFRKLGYFFYKHLVTLVRCHDNDYIDTLHNDIIS